MSTINLTVDLKQLSPYQIESLALFISSFSVGTASTILRDETSKIAELGVAIAEEKKKRAPRGSKVQAGALEGQERTESEVDNYEAAKEVPVADATDANDDIMGDNTTPLTFDDLRAITSTKTQIDRENIAKLRAKIAELGGEKLVDLQATPAVWPEFMEYANSL